MERKYKILFVVAVLLAFGFGFIFGSGYALKECISYGVNLAHQYTNVSFDNDKLANLLIKYRYKIEMAGGI